MFFPYGRDCKDVMLLYKYLLAIYNVDARCCNYFNLATGEVVDKSCIVVFAFQFTDTGSACKFVCGRILQTCYLEVFFDAAGNLDLFLVVVWVVSKIQVYFPDDFITFIDESHVTIPQIRAMYGGDHSRKNVLIDYGFRLPAAADNRPLKFDEFEDLTGQRVFVSATPADYELIKSDGLIVEQVVRPTGLLDPPIEIRPTENQVDDLLEEVRVRAERDERVLVTTLTKRMAEELDSYFQRMGVRCRYIHSDVDTMERVEIIEDFKKGLFDVLVGVNLLREGLDIPSVSLVAILDADKEGFLRSDTALTQTAGRAARNVNGLVIMYADSLTGSMRRTLEETSRRRAKQLAYNEQHHITPTQVATHSNVLVQASSKGKISAPTSYDDPVYVPSPDELGHGKVSVGLGHDSRREKSGAMVDGYVSADLAAVLQDPVIRAMSRDQVQKCIKEAERNMKKAAVALDFPSAAKYRDEMWALQEYLKVWKDR